MNLSFKSISTYNQLSELDNIDYSKINATSSCIFHGKNIDDRGDAIINYFSSKHQITKKNFIQYYQQDDSFLLDETSYKSRIIITKLMDYLVKYDYIIIDSTTLSYVEILIILFTINQFKEKISIDIFYIEPIEYNSRATEIHNISFDLSDDSGDIRYIKPFLLENGLDSTNKKSTTLFAFLGFESNRFENILDNDNEDIKYNEIIPIISVPGFQYGWENISLIKHYELLDDRKLSYVPADNPYAVYKFLKQEVQNSRNEQFVIMPLGTKPNAVGVAIFMVNYKSNHLRGLETKPIATKYDFPIKSQKRTTGIKLIQRYSLSN